ncbi:F-box/kelch-repeat protein At1g57790-like [Papaver somniferum]|uniref:F-box/kelch-repeat protein At1g57790-like n=1 Tax=Papaver somniferum TaxID=3469 RepID=UPI000E6F6088|nr:F-box/kelch-repeat protein At1g57790-like [Papaver somniferum]
MDRDSCYSVVSFSSLPTSSDCIVFAMDDTGVGFYIDFIRRGEVHWRSHIFHHTGITRHHSLTPQFFMTGIFFCVDLYCGTVGVFSAKDNSWKVLEKPHELDFGGITPGFLVECGGDLLIVKLEEFHWKPIRIFRLNFSEMKREEVKSLGEHVLFISHTSCASAVAPDSYMNNKIYFPRLYLNEGGIVFYSLETHSYRSRGGEHAANNLSGTEGWFRNCTWIQPNMAMSTAEELDWLKPPF